MTDDTLRTDTHTAVPYGTSDAPRIAVCGEARLEADPEIARTWIAVGARGEDRRTTLDDLSRRNTAALDLVGTYGDAVEKQETGALSVSPELTEHGRGERVRAYHGSARVTAEFADALGTTLARWSRSPGGTSQALQALGGRCRAAARGLRLRGPAGTRGRPRCRWCLRARPAPTGAATPACPCAGQRPVHHGPAAAVAGHAWRAGRRGDVVTVSRSSEQWGAQFNTCQ